MPIWDPVILARVANRKSEIRILVLGFENRNTDTDVTCDQNSVVEWFQIGWILITIRIRKKYRIQNLTMEKTVVIRKKRKWQNSNSVQKCTTTVGELTTQTPKLFYGWQEEPFENPSACYIHTLPRFHWDPTFNTKRVKFLKNTGDELRILMYSYITKCQYVL